MKVSPPSRFPVPRLKDCPEDIKARILAVQQKSGVPSVFLALAHNAMSLGPTRNSMQ